MGYPVFFYAFSFLCLAGALGVILARQAVYAVLSLVVTLFALSGLFVLLEAYFVAVIQVLIYAGAILVLFLFVVMLLDMAPEQLLHVKGKTLRVMGSLCGVLFFWQLAKAVRHIQAHFAPAASLSPVVGTTQAVGKLLFTTYALPFEVASLLLLVGVIGAVVLAKKKL